MWRTADFHRPTVQPLNLELLYRPFRTVEVAVLDDGRQADCFRTSNPDLLSQALKPIYRHISCDSRVELTGVEERRFLLGIVRNQKRERLSSLQAAFAFLAGR